MVVDGDGALHVVWAGLAGIGYSRRAPDGAPVTAFDPAYTVTVSYTLEEKGTAIESTLGVLAEECHPLRDLLISPNSPGGLSS
jgi:hypothetical protein